MNVAQDRDTIQMKSWTIQAPSMFQLLSFNIRKYEHNFFVLLPIDRSSRWWFMNINSKNVKFVRLSRRLDIFIRF